MIKDIELTKSELTQIALFPDVARSKIAELKPGQEYVFKFSTGVELRAPSIEVMSRRARVYSVGSFEYNLMALEEGI